MGRYVDIGINYPYLILGGICLPDNVQTGRFEYGYQTHQNYYRYFVGCTGMHYAASRFIEIWAGNDWQNKTIVAWQWTTKDNHVIKNYLKTTGNSYEVIFQVRDETAGVNFTLGSAYNLQTVLQACFQSDKKGVNFVLARPEKTDGMTDAEWMETVGCFCFGDIINGEKADSNAYYAKIDSFIADALGTTNQILAYEALSGLSVEDIYLGGGIPRKKDPGVHEGKDDVIDFPNLPTDSGLSTKFLRMYHCSDANLDDLADDLWSNNFTSNILKNYDSPFENIISLNILPFAVTGTSATIQIGNYQTSVVAEQITSQFVDLDGGYVILPEENGNQLDYAPATRCQIFIPFIGYRDLDMDDLCGGKATLKYRVDLLTGNILAMIKVEQDQRYRHEAVEYHFNGNCAAAIPISGANYNNLYSSLMQSITAGAFSVASGNIGGVVGSASSISSAKPQYQRSGNMSGNIGFMSQTRAFVLISGPEQGFDPNIKKSRGIRCNEEYSFNSISGFTSVRSWRPNATLSSVCSKEELDEIDRILKEGVIL